MKKVALFAVFLMIALTLTRCASHQKMDQKVDTMEVTVQSLTNENTALRNRVADLEKKVEQGDASLKSEIESSKTENLKLKESLAEIEKKNSQPTPGTREGDQGGKEGPGDAPKL